MGGAEHSEGAGAVGGADDVDAKSGSEHSEHSEHSAARWAARRWWHLLGGAVVGWGRNGALRGPGASECSVWGDWLPVI